MSTAIRQIGVIAFGDPVSGISFAVGETAAITITCQDPVTRAPFDLTGANVTMTITERGAPMVPPGGGRQGNIQSPATAGIVIIPYNPSDTVPCGIPVQSGFYEFDVFTTDVSGNRLQQLAYGTIRIKPAATLPATPVVPLPSQLPLAQGPAGVPGAPATTPETVTGNAAIDQFAIIKSSMAVAGRYEMLLASDSPSLMEGVAMTACGGAGQTFSAQFVEGTVTTMLSDGTATIGVGATVAPSTTVAGRVKAGGVSVVGSNVGPAVAATLNALVQVR